MRYLGGKYRIAKHIAREINKVRRPGQLVWDAFCGGLSVGAAVGAPVVCSDVNADLIAMYQAVRAGWVPPDVSKEEHARLKNSAPSPLRTFAGFGCSFGGMWFSAWAAPRAAVKDGQLYSMADSSRNSLLKDVPRVTDFACMSFFDVEPSPEDMVLYCDPPYRGTAGYSAVGAFDHDAFETRVSEWSKFCPVFVSEYTFPLGREVWSSGKPNGSACFAKNAEKLFLVGA
jgi:DNA adenine methylase